MLTLNKSSLTMSLPHNSNAEFHYVWLRDNCPCPECKHPTTTERILVSSEIPDSISPSNAEIDDETLRVVWNDGEHASLYSLDWLAQNDYSANQQNHDTATGSLQLWDRELESRIPRFDYQSLYDDPKALLSWAETVRDTGLTVINNAPTQAGEIERFAEYVAVVRETIYDRLHNVRATPGEYNAYNVASTSLELKPHTDMPNYNNPPGVQMFHFLANESVGGDSTAVDGFFVAQKLREEDPEAFAVLAHTPVVFRMFSARGDVQSANPMFTLDAQGELKVVRFSNQLLQTNMLASAQMESFYRAYRKLGRMIESDQHKIQFRLNSGDIMVTNNLRVLHGRTAYTGGSGERHLQLSYIDFDDVLSRIRMLKKTSADTI